MTFLELAAQRYSVRKFSDKKVEQKDIDTLLEAARLSPSAVNLQPTRILVIQSEDSLEKLKQCTPYHFNAPLAMLICYDSSIAYTRKDDNHCFGAEDSSIATTHIMMAAADIGLGTTWVGKFEPAVVSETYKLPKDYVPLAILPIGYPAEDSKPSSLHTKRNPITDMAFYDSF